jgi:plasmid stabilization system protein ParE
MKYRFTPEARIELISAAEFYESQRWGLGSEFSVEVGLAIAQVLEAPERWPEMEPGIRRFRLDRFPYALIYRIEQPRAVQIISVFDLRRRPESWRNN